MRPESVKIDGARYVVTVDPTRRVLEDASILLEGDRIAAIGSSAQMQDVRADRVIDARRMVVTPGLINTHDHLYPHLIRGVFGDQLIGAPYITESAKLRASMTEHEQYIATLGAVTEHLKYGTTCILSPGDAERIEPQLRAVDLAGSRAVLGRCVTDRQDIGHTMQMSTDEALADLRRTVVEYDRQQNGRVRAWVMLTYGLGGAVSEELLVGAKRLADELGVGLTFHQSARQAQVDDALRQYGMRPLQYLDKLGVVGPNVLLSHAANLDLREVDIIARTRTAVAMCPMASLRLGFGTVNHGKLPEMLAAGATVSIGTDATDFSTADLMRSVFLEATLYKDARQDTAMVAAEEAFEMATLGGATALGLQDEIGSIEVGKRADLVLFDTDRLEWAPLLNPITTLVYNADGRSVHTVIVGGKTVIEGGCPTFVDESALVDELQELAEGLLARAEVVVRPSRWPLE